VFVECASCPVRGVHCGDCVITALHGVTVAVDPRDAVAGPDDESGLAALDVSERLAVHAFVASGLLSAARAHALRAQVRAPGRRAVASW